MTSLPPTRRLLLRAAALFAVALGGCGGNDMPPDPDGIARYGALRYDAAAPVGSAGGAATAAPTPTVMPTVTPTGPAASVAVPAGVPGGAPAAPPAAGGPGRRAPKYKVAPVEHGGTIKITCVLSKAIDVQKIP